MTRITRPESLQQLFAKRGTIARIKEATGLSYSYVSNWTYIPDAYVKIVAETLGVPQRDLPRNPNG